MSITLDQISGLAGHGNVVTDHGDKVGGIGQIYLDDSSGAPDWVTVKTGLFGSAETFVPLEGARLAGSDIVVSYTKDLIKAAPRVDTDGSLSPQEEDALYRHYSLRTSAGAVDTTDRSSDQGRSGRDSDTAMTRSDEQLRVGTQRVETGRARLRKHVVTEQVRQTVPVSHEEVRVAREPITEANRAKSLDGPEITEAVHEVTLHAETPVVDKEVVPVERVRMDTATVSGEQTVSDEVRKERVELDDPTDDATTGH